MEHQTELQMELRKNLNLSACSKRLHIQHFVKILSPLKKIGQLCCSTTCLSVTLVTQKLIYTLQVGV